LFFCLIIFIKGDLWVKKKNCLELGIGYCFFRKIFFNIFEVMKNILFKLFYFFVNKRYLIYLLEINIFIFQLNNFYISLGIGDWGLGIGDWGLGIGDWAQSPIPNPQSPIPNPHPH
jgi:hypothetical protein